MDFRSPDRDAVLNHAEEAFGDQPEYLWMKFPREIGRASCRERV